MGFQTFTYQPNNRPAVQVLIDDQDVALYLRTNWAMSRGSLHRRKDSAQFHRLIKKAKPGFFVRFKNGNRMDFRRKNLYMTTADRAKRRPRKPFIRETSSKRRPVAVHFVTVKNRRRNGLPGFYKPYQYVCASFTTKVRAVGSDRSRVFNIRFRADIYGHAEATRRALSWRIDRMKEHGFQPSPQVLAMLARVTKMARVKVSTEDVYGGNAEYKNCKVVLKDINHAFDYLPKR